MPPKYAEIRTHQSMGLEGLVGWVVAENTHPHVGGTGYLLDSARPCILILLDIEHCEPPVWLEPVASGTWGVWVWATEARPTERGCLNAELKDSSE